MSFGICYQKRVTLTFLRGTYLLENVVQISKLIILCDRLDFDWVLIHASHEKVLGDRHKNTLRQCLEQGYHILNDYKRYLGHVFLLMGLEVGSPHREDWLEVAVMLLRNAKVVLSDEHFRDLKVFLIQENANSSSLLRNIDLPRSFSSGECAFYVPCHPPDFFSFGCLYCCTVGSFG